MTSTVLRSRPAAFAVLACSLISTLASDPVRAQTWTPVASMAHARGLLAGAELGGKIYAVGGLSRFDVLDVLEVYDPATDRWTLRAPMPTAREQFAAASAGGLLYAVGGLNGFDPRPMKDAVEAYDPATDSWSVKAPLPVPTHNLTLSAVGGRIYAIGGYVWPSGSADVFEYDPLLDTWTSRPPMPTPREKAAAAVVNGEIYVIGGFSGGFNLATVESFDPVTGVWSTRASLPGSRVRGVATVRDGLIYLSGGGPHDVLVYDPALDRWESGVPIPVDKHEHIAVTVGDSLYVVGGKDVPGTHTATAYRLGLPPPATSSVHGLANRRTIRYQNNNPNLPHQYGSVTYSGFPLAPFGTSLGFTGDDEMLTSIPLGFGFRWPGGLTTTSVDVDVNGRLMPGGSGATSDFSPTPIELTDAPHPTIAPLWIDYDIRRGGDVRMSTTPTSATFTWDGVQQLGGSIAGITVQVTLTITGTIWVQYVGTTAFEEAHSIGPQSALVGISDGASQGISSSPSVELDLSDDQFVFNGDIYEFFDATAGERLDLQLELAATPPVIGGEMVLSVSGLLGRTHGDAPGSGIMMLGTSDPAIDLGSALPGLRLDGAFLHTDATVATVPFNNSMSIPIPSNVPAGVSFTVQALLFGQPQEYTYHGDGLTNGVTAVTGF